MSVFADASALVQRYVDEPGADAVRVLGPTVASAVAPVEVAAAVWRKHRLGELEASDAELLLLALDAELAAGIVSLVAVEARVLERAAALLAAHPLGAAGAMQLASALVAREALPDLEGFASFHPRVRAAAAAEGLALLP